MDHRRALRAHALGEHPVEHDKQDAAQHRHQDILQRIARLAKQAGGGDQKGERYGRGQGQQQVGFNTLQDFTFT
ncbi:hypothetical protein D3C72_2396860 [compost metagenome]